MPIICMFRGIAITINWSEHNPPHFHARYGGDEVLIGIADQKVIAGNIPQRQLNMVIGWAAFHMDELIDDWELTRQKHEPFKIEPLK